MNTKENAAPAIDHARFEGARKTGRDYGFQRAEIR
jgi:hypothetical protein